MDNLIYLSSCASTQDEIMKFINNRDFSETALGIYTFDQFQGRGQYGNRWEILPNQNLAYSFALNTKNILVRDNDLNFYTALLLRDFLANLTETKVFIKWPNDLILHEKKICGMLFERKGDYFIGGIGINILQESFEEISKAGSLLTQTSKSFDLKNLAENLHHYLHQNLLKLPANDDLLNQYNVHLFRREKISVFEKDQIRQNGIIKQVDKDGFLWIELEHEGLQKFFHKEIQLLY